LSVIRVLTLARGKILGAFLFLASLSEKSHFLPPLEEGSFPRLFLPMGERMWALRKIGPFR